MSQNARITATQNFLSGEEQDALIAVIQGRVAHTPEDVALERVVVDTTVKQAAMEKLMSSYVKLINKVAWSAKVIDREDAESELKLAFIEAVHAHDLTRGVPFGATIRPILLGTLADAQLRSKMIVVPETTARRYWQKMGAAGMDATVALASCTGEDNDLSRTAFLAAHHAIKVASYEVTAGDVDKSMRVSGGSDDIRAYESSLSDGAPTAEDRALEADLVRSLFEQITDRQETICRLRYGFTDPATENVLRNFAEAVGGEVDGFHLGDVLSDIQTASVIGMSPKTLQRQRADALKTMRAALDIFAAGE